MYISEYIVNIFSCKFYKQEISAKRATLENAGEALEKQAWICSGVEGIIQTTWSDQSVFNRMLLWKWSAGVLQI